MLKPNPDVAHYILTHFQWLWDVINNTFLRDILMRLVITGVEPVASQTPEEDASSASSNRLCSICFPPRTVRSNLVPYPPTYNSKYGYLNWESMSNLSYYTRLLPPVPDDCPTPMGVKGQSLLCGVVMR